ncbi:DUF11 domain-containing protein [Streptomyces uncialis]|uniref:DUF11 domain-containing protein n=1 Tax=Streptomyces uncialis TaxID=1048205 RepID=UPI000A65D2C0|nr:DUF11 domain-containing protein [Streptomyces uncialis]
MRSLLARACSALAVLTVVTGATAPATASATPSAPAPAPGAAPRAPFSCAGDILLSAGLETTQLHRGVAVTGGLSFTPIGPPSARYDAIGLNPADRYTYAIRSQGPGWNLLRIDDAGAVTDLGTVGLPTPILGLGAYTAGAFDTAGNFYVAGGSDNLLQRIDVNTRTFTTVTLSQNLGGVDDFTYRGGYLWGVSATGALTRIDPATGAVTVYAAVVPPSVTGYGGAFTYGNGDLGFLDNAGLLRRVSVTDPLTPVFRLLSTQTTVAVSGNVDATSCFVAATDLGVVKTGPATVRPGGTVTYRLRVTNHGPGPSSGWTLTDQIPAGLTDAATTTPGCSVTGGNLSCAGGALAVGAHTDVTVTGTAGPGTPTFVNTANVRGNDPDPNPANDSSTATTRVADLTITKRQEGPATVDPGAKVTYTITVTNDGPLAYTAGDPASITDDLSRLLDDARYNGDARATSGTVRYDNPELFWSGALAPGASATVTFSVTVNARTFGNLKLDNTVVSDIPGSNCPEGSRDARCTTHGKVKAKDKDKAEKPVGDTLKDTAAHTAKGPRD